MPFELKVTAENWDELVSSLPGGGSDANIFDTMDFQALAAAFGKRAEAEGYDFELARAGSLKTLSQAEQRKEAARAKLRGELEGSLATPTDETEKEEPEAAPAAKRRRHTYQAGAVDGDEVPQKAKTNGSIKEETADERKARCILIARDLYGHHKAAVMKILHEHGGGVKNFSQVAAENFVPIAAALEALKESVGG